MKIAIESVERVRPEYLRGVATGDVLGEGVWRLETVESNWTSIAFDWQVRTNRKWMEFLAPLARPVFISSHDHVMKKGAEGLASHLSSEIRNFSASAS